MRKRWLYLSILAAVAVCRANIVYSQTADDIVEKHLAAMGGRAALEKVTSRVMTGVISVSTPGGDLSGSMEVYNKAPNKIANAHQNRREPVRSRPDPAGSALQRDKRLRH